MSKNSHRAPETLGPRSGLLKFSTALARTVFFLAGLSGCLRAIFAGSLKQAVFTHAVKQTFQPGSPVTIERDSFYPARTHNWEAIFHTEAVSSLLMKLSRGQYRWSPRCLGIFYYNEAGKHFHRWGYGGFCWTGRYYLPVKQPCDCITVQTFSIVQFLINNT